MRDIVSPLDGFRSPFGPLISGGAAAFTPASLFASGEEGAWFESSPTTAFRSTTNLTPCDVGETCGFLLDKSQGAGYSGGEFTGLGSELVTNGTFDTDVSGWSVFSGGATLSQVGGYAVLTSASGSTIQDRSVYQTLNLIVGKTYLISGTIWSSGPFAVAIQTSPTDDSGSIRTTNGTNSASATSFELTFTATNSTMYLQFRNAGSQSVSYFDNISVRELPGNHATQTTPDSRPVLQQTAGGLYYLDFDGADDHFIAAIDLSSTDTVSLFTGAEKASDVAFGVIAGHGANDAAGHFNIGHSYLSGGANRLSWGVSFYDVANYNVAYRTYTAPDTRVFTSIIDASVDSISSRLDGAAVTASSSAGSAGDSALTALRNDDLYVGALYDPGVPTIAFFNGKLFSLIVRGAASTAQEISDTESYVANLSGVTL